MRRDLMDILACPVCKSPLTLEAEAEAEETDEVISGSLHCPKVSPDLPHRWTPSPTCFRPRCASSRRQSQLTKERIKLIHSHALSQQQVCRVLHCFSKSTFMNVLPAPRFRPPKHPTRRLMLHQTDYVMPVAVSVAHGVHLGRSRGLL